MEVIALIHISQEERVLTAECGEYSLPAFVPEVKAHYIVRIAGLLYGDDKGF